MPDIVPSRPTAGAPIETAWGQALQDVIEGIQVGTVALASSATPSTAVVFPRAYLTAPIVVCQMVDPASGQIQPYAVAITASGFTATARRVDGAATAATIHWIAIGTLATPG